MILGTFPTLYIYTILYVDDTSILRNRKDYAHLIELPNIELEKVSIWLKANKLSLNVKKTFYMVIHRSTIKTDAHTVIIMDKVCL